MKKKYSRILGLALTLMLVASLFGFAAPVSAANTAWSPIANPGATLATGLNLANAEVGPIAVSPDGGTIFAAVQCEAAIIGVSATGTAGVDDWALLQSADGGHNWTATGLINNPGPITGIAISSNFATDNTMYVAAGSVPLAPAPAVFRSNNSGAAFVELKAVPIDAGGTATAVINSIDMWPASPYPYVMVGTNTDVWVLQDAPFGVWLDQEIATGAGVWVNVMAVAFAPDFATTNYIWAVVGNDSGAAIFGNITCTNSPGAWGTLLANTGPILAAAAAGACIAFPDDYNSATNPYLWVGLDSGVPNLGGVWRIRGLPVPAPASQFIQQYGGAPVAGTAAADIRSVAVSGGMAAATILAGQQDTAAIVGSLNGGINWLVPVMKQPTGLNTTYVVMAPDFATSNVAYVGTSDALGAESAFQVTRNGGMSWNQFGLIDTAFTVINDIAVVSLDTIFMVSNAFSLWKTEDATATAPVWERIMTGGTVFLGPNPLAGNIAIVETSPEFLTDGVVYVTNATTGIVKATDGGDIFARLPAALANITALHLVDATSAYHGAVGQFYRTDDGGYSWLGATTPPPGAPTAIVSIATVPAGAMPPGALLVGAANGSVFMSMNRGVSFFPLAFFLTTGNTYVAFDANYASNFLVYAGGPGAVNGAIWRMDISQAALGWTSIDGTMPTATPAAAADSFQFDDNVVAGDTGTITVTTGSVILAPQGAATVAGTVAFPNTLTVVPAMGAVAWTSPVGVGVATDTVLVTAATVNSAGTWTAVGATTVTAVTDVDGDVGLTAANWYLPDVAGVGAAAPSVINGLVMSPDGTLYGSNFLAAQGVERSLNPTALITAPAEGAIAPVFERMNRQIPATATLGTAATPASMELVVDETLDIIGSKNVLFAIDTTGTALGVDQILTFTDTLAAPVVLTAPETGTIYPRVTDVTLDWERLTGAQMFNWQIARDAFFTLVADEGFSIYPTVTSNQLRAGQTYHWRVRVDGPAMGAPGMPLLSRWSESRTFTTELGGRVWHPFLNIGAVAPGPGASDVLTKPTFQWNGADWATSYEFVLADNAAFTGATTKTLTTTSWVCDKDLGYSTTWYWKVRALSGTSESEWSDVGVFTTEAEPVEPTPPVVVQDTPDIIVEVPEAPPAVEVTPVAPGYLLAIIIIGAVLVIFVVVLIVRTRRPV